MRRLACSLGLVVSLLACDRTSDGYVVLNVNADGTVDKAAISHLMVSIAAETRSYPLTAALPGTLGILTNRQGTLAVSVVGIGNQKTQGSWSGSVTATVGHTSQYLVVLSCNSGGCGTVIQRDGAVDGVSDDGGTGSDGSGGSAGVAGMDGGGAGDAGTAGTSGMGGKPGCSDSPSCMPFTKIKCGELACDNRTQVCCRKFATAPDLNFHCAPIGTCGEPDNVIQFCNSAANCETGQSCFLQGKGAQLQTYSCVGTETAFSAAAPGDILCRSQSDCPLSMVCTPPAQCINGDAANCVANPLAYLSSCR